ncbi:MAG: glycosyltransferase family 4 protein [Salinivirgaceae bacterium]|nr:glycosyltransferase family 4 protein [Salinivirgaceae bacterium]
MKLLVYSHDAAFYGAPRAVFELTEQLKYCHKIIYIIPEYGPFENILKEHGYEYHILPNPSWVSSVREQGYSRWYFLKHIVKTFCLFIISMIDAYKKSKSLIKKIKPDMIFVNTSTAPVGLYAAKNLKIKSVLWVHESICNKNGLYVPTFFSKRYVARVFNKADLIICPSQFLKSYIEKTFGISKSEVLTNPIGFVPSKTKCESEYRFGTVGYLSERKGQLEFFKLMIANLPKAKLAIFGDGTNDYAQELKKMAERYSDNIKLFGYESNPDVIYSTFDIYVNMGIDETFGRTTVEAMRAGKLVFGRRSGATPEIIKDGENGFLFDKVEDIFEILRKYDTEKGRKKLQAIRKCGHETSMAYMPSEIAKRFDYILKNL